MQFTQATSSFSSLHPSVQEWLRFIDNEYSLDEPEVNEIIESLQGEQIHITPVAVGYAVNFDSYDGAPDSTTNWMGIGRTAADAKIALFEQRSC